MEGRRRAAEGVAAATPFFVPVGKPQTGKRGRGMRTKVEINQQLLDNQRDALRACMTVDGEMNKRLREAIFNELKAARDSIMQQIRFDNGDPRGTAHSVKRYIAGKYLGGVVSIASYKAKASGTKNSYEAPRTLRPGQRGGNRRARGARTAQILSYGPQDRAFILNWINSGTQDRVAGFGRMKKFDMNSTGGKGRRGAIAPRNFFHALGEPAMEKAVENLGKIVEEEFAKLIKS